MPANKTAVCNLALSHLGISLSIADIATDTTVPGAACNLFYDDVLDEVLAAHPWPFATKTAALVSVGANPTTEWAASWRYPSDCVAFRRVLPASPLRIEAEKTRIPFRISRDGTGRLIYTNQANPVGEYTERVSTTTLWPADFSQLVALLLAHRIGPRVAKGDQLKLADRALVLYKEKLVEAIATVIAEERKNEPETVVATDPQEDICNQALAHLGVDHEVQDLTTELTVAARVCRQFYAKTRDEVLRSFPWSFATKFATLSQVAVNPNDEWAFSYRYPTDCIQVRKILNTSNRVTAGDSRVPYKLGQDGTGLLIFTDQASAKLEYTVQHDTPAQYPPDFKNQLALLLGVRIAPRLIENLDRLKVITDRVQGLYEQGLAAVVAAAAEEKDLSPETDATTEPKEDICNAALAHLGVDVEIQDLETEKTRYARAFRQFYDKTRDDVLRAFPWPQARKLAALSSVASPPTGWSNQYRYPSDCLHLRKVYAAGDAVTSRLPAKDSRQQFVLSHDATGMLILCDIASAFGEYTARLDDPTKYYTSDFSNLFALLLAQRVAPRVVEPANLVALTERCQKLYEQGLAAAYTAAAAEEREFPPETDATTEPKENICNMALMHLGADVEIQDLETEKTKAARACRQFYDQTRDDTLRAFPWPQATVIATLSTVSAVSSWASEWSQQYRYPSDCILLRKILDPNNRLRADQSRVPFKIGYDATGMVIFTDQANAIAEYTAKIDDPVKYYTADFKNVFAVLMAQRIAPQIVPKADLKGHTERLQLLYEQAIATAYRNSAMEERDMSPETSATSEPKEDICNAALVHMGLDIEIQDLETERSKAARTFRQLYDKTRDQVLREFPWPVATKFVALTLVAEDPTDEWAYSYRYPTDCLHLRRILNQSSRIETQTSRIPYRLGHDASGILVYCDLEDAEAEYTARLDDPVKYYSADFRESFALLLGAYASLKLIEPKKDAAFVRREVLALYESRRAQSQANAANEIQADQPPDGELVRARD